MAKFKVGDRARLVAIHPRANLPLPVGCVVRIVGTEVWRDRNGLYEFQIDTIPSTDGVPWNVMGWQLEPLTPDLGSWEEIERLTKWKPQGVAA